MILFLMNEYRLPLKSKITLGLLVAMSFFLMCDMYITPAIVSELALEWNVSQSAIGFVGSAFTLLGAVLSIVFGYSSDKVSRKKVLVLVVLIGEIPCFLTGLKIFTGSFTGFVILRILTGIGVGGIYPLIFSLLSDYFTDRHRATAVAFVEMAWGLGTIMGPILANWGVSSEYGWRLAFILAAVPNVPIAIFFFFFAEDPKRGATESAIGRALQDGAEYNYKIKLSDFKILFSKKTNIFLFLQGIPGTVPWGLLTFWIITFFREVRGLNIGEATLLWEVFGIGSVIGAVVWGILGDKLFSKKASYLPMLCTAGILLGTIPCFIFLNIPITSPGFLLTLGVVGGITISTASANNKAMLINVNQPEHRGSVFAVFNVTDNIGKGIGPALGGVLLGVTGSYLVVMNVAICFWFLCGLIFIGVIFSINKDRKSLLDLLEERGDEMEKQLEP